MTRPLKMWTGNLDGERWGAVVAASKARAMKVLGLGRKTFDDYWVQQSGVDSSLAPEQVYTRPILSRPDPESIHSRWQKGLCPL